MTLSIADVEKRFGETWALRGASFTARRGELHALIGPNGSGKTTLLACAAGLLAPDAMTAKLDGAPLVPARRSRALLYLADGIAPWPDETLDTLLALVPRMLGAARGTTFDDARAALVQALALTPHLAQRLGELSKGQRKRALLAIALLAPQPYLLLDEPFDGLDLRQLQQVASLLHRTAANGRALVLSIHQLSDAARVADRLTLLDAGRTVAEGSLDELRALVGEPDADLEDVFLALT